jgi:hypothetical protein
VTYLPDVILCCAILHNLLLGQNSNDVGRLLGVLQAEGWQEESHDEDPYGIVDQGLDDMEVGQRPWGQELQRSFAIFLGAQRGLLE